VRVLLGCVWYYACVVVSGVDCLDVYGILRWYNGVVYHVVCVTGVACFPVCVALFWCLVQYHCVVLLAW